MSVKGTSVRHCSGSTKGELIKKFKSRKKALAMHRAIMASKKRKAGKGNKYAEALKNV